MINIRIGVPREIKEYENRVALSPEGAARLVSDGHDVFIESGAGAGSGFPDKCYKGNGAKIASAKEIWGCELVVKVKEPLKPEYRYLNEKSVLFTYLHLAGVDRLLTLSLLKKKVTSIGYETVEDSEGKLPLLAPMSAVAGNMAVAMGSYYLAKSNGGKGVQLGTVMGRRNGKVIVIGDGVVGIHAAGTAYAMGANVYVFTRHDERKESLRQQIGAGLNAERSSPKNIAHHIKDADLVVGAVLLRGAKAPYVVTKNMVKSMQKGSVMVDVSIDQGGCIETSKPTSHRDPVYVKHGVIHYCVANMPGAYPRTSTIALTDATLPYLLKLANEGIASYIRNNAGFAKGVNTFKGYITCKPVAEALNLGSRFRSLEEIV